MIYNFRKKLQQDKIDEFPSELISEGLILSWEYDKLIKQINKISSTIICKLDSFSLKIIINRSEITDIFINKLNQLLLLSGYQISTYTIDKNVRGKGNPNKYVLYNKYNNIEFELNKRFDTTLIGIPTILYHVTEKENLNKINKNGIYPKSKNKIEYHPDRVYLFDNIEGATFYKDDIINRFNLNNEDLIILKIDTRLINNMTLHKDPKFGDTDFGALYTYDHISPFDIIEII
ncbi:hypothetical protein M0Q97_11185 [Candidatus Dojkabacteria bacterium]|jgi:hypothetical protein|nr:hypothetical protein [Candidatus Dojkabacteria bacterium]